ncbi:MAG TPA: chaperone modulator CbpM [Steroidobacteraceae bacterium]|nr:chaperone modulator CbpM [Steroidobacteraceae bacterium]
MTNIDLILEGEMLDDGVWYAFAEFCSVLRAEDGLVIELVESGLLEPSGATPEAWRFPARDLLRARTVTRLVQDLGVNLEGAGIILDLLEERRALRARLAYMERLLAG